MNENFREMFSSLYSIKREVDRGIVTYLNGIKSRRMREILLYYAKEGKRHLPWFTVLSAECLGGNRKRAVKCAALLEILHKISLMVDDIVDRHDRRKGRPTPTTVFGEQCVILASVCGFAFALKNMESEMGRDVFRNVCTNMESISGGVLNEFEKSKSGNMSAQKRAHYSVNKKFFRLFVESGIALAPGKVSLEHKKTLFRYSEKIAEIATIYDDAEDVMIDLKNGKMRRILQILEKFSLGRRISDMTEGEIKRLLMKSGSYRKMAGKIDSLADEAVRSLEPLPGNKAKNTLASFALSMKEIHREQKNMEIQKYIEKMFTGMEKNR